MSLRQCARLWNRFFFAPVPPQTIALYRIFFGLLVMADAVLLWPDWLTWFGEKGAVSLKTAQLLYGGTRINLFSLLPSGDFWVMVFFWVFLIAAFSLTIGLFTRASSVLVFAGLVSLHHRNPFILNSGDTMLRVTGFLLVFAPASAAFSVDRMWRMYKGQEPLHPQPQSPWAQRLIQIQVAFAYFATFYVKTQGSMWIDGTALYYVVRLDEFRRFPVPLLQNLAFIQMATWFTLVVEFALAVLVWFKELRYWVLAAAVCLHLSIDYSMNIPLFQWIMLATYITFVDSSDLNRVLWWMRDRLERWGLARRWLSNARNLVADRITRPTVTEAARPYSHRRGRYV